MISVQTDTPSFIYWQKKRYTLCLNSDNGQNIHRGRNCSLTLLPGPSNFLATHLMPWTRCNEISLGNSEFYFHSSACEIFFPVNGIQVHKAHQNTLLFGSSSCMYASTCQGCRGQWGYLVQELFWKSIYVKIFLNTNASVRPGHLSSVVCSRDEIVLLFAIILLMCLGLNIEPAGEFCNLHGIVTREFETLIFKRNPFT